MALEPGIERTDEFVVEGRLLTDVGGTLGSERPVDPGDDRDDGAHRLHPRLREPARGKATVGFEVCIKHVAAAAEGAQCVVKAKLREVVDDRKLHFDVEVLEGERTLGVGTHQRRVVSTESSLARPTC